MHSTSKFKTKVPCLTDSCSAREVRLGEASSPLGLRKGHPACTGKPWGFGWLALHVGLPVEGGSVSDGGVVLGRLWFSCLSKLVRLPYYKSASRSHRLGEISSWGTFRVVFVLV